MLRVAVDGPAGAGKSTAAKLVAGHLNYTYLDTGAMYRAITLKALRNGWRPDIAVTDEDYWIKLVHECPLRIATHPNEDKSINNHIFLNDEDVTEAVRTPEVNRHVSIIAAIDEVRDHLVALQRKLAKGGGIVMDGRDIGTVVLPDAELKFFLTASLQERAKRRLAELKTQGYHVELGELVEQIRERDLLDSTRATAPLRKAEDAILIDTTDLEIDDVVSMMLSEVRKGEAHCFIE